MIEEPQLGTQVITELMEDDNEGIELLLEFMSDNQGVPTTFYAIDEFLDEDIELKTSDYLTSKQIDFLNALFIECDGWALEQIKAILKCTK